MTEPGSSVVRLEPPRLADQSRFLAAVRRSRKLHRPWVSPPDTAEKFQYYVKKLRSPRDRAHFVYTDDGELVGVIHLSEIVRGAFRSAYLGFYAFAPHAGRGLMKRGLSLAISEAFGAQKLHRLEANIQPANHASRGLVQSLGFECEGLSPRYLKIGGRWRDHERWAIRSEIFKPRR